MYLENLCKEIDLEIQKWGIVDMKEIIIAVAGTGDGIIIGTTKERACK